MDRINRLWMALLTLVMTLWLHPAWAQIVDVVSPTEMQAEAIRSPEEPYFSVTDSIAPGTLDLISAVHRAVEWHPVISESVVALQRERENVRAARAGYFPQIGVNFVAGRDTEDDRGGDGHVVQIYASQMLYDFGKVSSEVDLAMADMQRSRAVVLQAIDTVARDTAQAAIEVQRYQALLQSAEEQIEGVSAITALVQMRSDRGASSRSDVLQARSRMEAARASKQRVEAELNRWRSTLQYLMGSRDRFSMSMEIPDAIRHACEVVSPEISAVPEVLIAEAARAEAMARLEEARAGAWPTLSLDASVNNYLDQQYVDARALDQNESAVFLNLSMPIYQGGRISANKASGVHALRAADAAKDAARVSVMQALLAAQEEASGLSRSLSILNSRERAIAETRDLYRKQYSSLGTRTLLDLLNAEQELHQARQEKNNARYDLSRLQIDCLYNLGALRRAFELEGREIQGVEVLP
ncbi:TolC family outer membrane protein [Microbulbifer thermotolerans]|nr:TolC family outer membrane protein [Microbulbifer thermotolerans]MCX2794783.1 TolC family outer membrane protein [Microbulbifer thermotolerans]WKT59449.1 TolC family outer membrane protein [Microbulbifer thermotolerans]